MADLRRCIEMALDSDHQPPPWMEQPCYPSQDLDEIAQRAIDVFIASQNPNGTIRGIGWWQVANGYTAIALKDLHSGSRCNYNEISTLLRKCELHRPGLINEFNDDSLWWAMCCIHMYSASNERDVWFLVKAKAIWRHVRDSDSMIARGQVTFHDLDMEGGCWWKTVPRGNQINAISTALFAECAMRLARIAMDKSKKQSSNDDGIDGEDPSIQEYVEAARSSLGWILRTRYRPRQGVVLDGFDIERRKANDWTFTYTTGVSIGVCALLYEMTQEEDYLTLAIHMAWKSMRRDKWVEENGTLTESGAYGPGTHNPAQNNDAVGFKSVLIRHLATLHGVIRRMEPEMPEARYLLEMIRQFVNINFHSQEQRNTNGRGQYGPWWNGPFALPTSHSQMAVLDVMASVILVNQ